MGLKEMERGCDSAGRRTDCRPDMEEPWLMDDSAHLGAQGWMGETEIRAICNSTSNSNYRSLHAFSLRLKYIYCIVN